MRLKAFGCSFIHGTDLHDDGRYDAFADYSRFTWPALLARHLGYDYSCYAKPGMGNMRILERLMTHLAANQRDFYVIGWSWADRFDYTGEPTHHNLAGWRTILPHDQTKLAEFYYRDLHSELRDQFQTLICIRTAIDMLKNKGCPFIMTWMDRLIWENSNQSSPAVTDTQDYIRPYMTDWNGKTFYEFALDGGYPISDTAHPLEEAHEAAANALITRLDSCVNNKIKEMI